ncbi:hypothetical protein COX84_01130, partial [Candidatus Micrarchaeota archaeon CG_4_10_14_0_2_um_filter_49_7]
MKNNKKGMALIAALMTAFIFLALVSTLVLLSTAGSRQANYAKKATIALHLAEAGIADAIYRLNYCTATGGTFPFGPYPFASGQSSEIPFGTPNVESELVSATEIKGKVEEKGGSYEVKWDTSTTPYKLISTGTYQGIKRALSVQIRGETDSAEDRQYEKQGIPEAFNKHVIYADTVTYAAGTVDGNIAYKSSLTGSPSGTNTKTEIPSALSDFCKADTDVAFPDEPSSYSIYLRRGYAYPTSLSADNHTDTWFNCPEVPVNGADHTVAEVHYSVAGDEYTFTDTRIDYSFYVQRDPDGANVGNVVFNHANNRTSKFVRADEAITISDDITTDTAMATDSAAFRASSVTVNPGRTINGDFIVKNTPTIALSAGVVIEGTLGCDGDITLGNNITINPDASGGSREAAIIGFSDSGPITININSSPTITLGTAQKRAIIAYTTSTGGAVTINVNADLQPQPPIASKNKAAIVAYTNSANNAVVTIGGTANVDGLIYAHSANFPTNVGNINLNSTGNISGGVVASGTVDLQAGTLTWDSRPFVDATDTDTQIYQGFSGGRRV